MTLILSADDLGRFEAVSRAMLSSVEGTTVGAWQRAVAHTLSALLRGRASILCLPSGTIPDEASSLFSVDAPGLAEALSAYAVDLTAAGLGEQDPRRASRMRVFSWQSMVRMTGRLGQGARDASPVRAVLEAHGIHDLWSFYAPTPAGAAMVAVLYGEAAASPFGGGTEPLLRALLPSLKVGLEALRGGGARGVHVGGEADAYLLFGNDHRERHCSAALCRVLDAEPERDHLMAEIRQLARELHPLGRPRAGRARAAAYAPVLRTVGTGRARYELRGVFMPAGTDAGEADVMIAVTPGLAPVLPSAERLRERYALTRREADVALLLAEGLSNDALAQRLFISPHTARRHTEQVLAKLGLHSRKALAFKLIQDHPVPAGL